MMTKSAVIIPPIFHKNFPMDLSQTPLSGLSCDDYKQGSSQTCQLANYDGYWEVVTDCRPIMAKERAWEEDDMCTLLCKA